MKTSIWSPSDASADDAGSSGSGFWADCQRLGVSLRKRGVGRLALDLLLEVALVFTVLKVYNIVRNQFGSVVVPPSVAHDHAVKLVNLEKALGFFFEERIQAFFMTWPDFIRFWNVFYWTAHSSNTIGALLGLFFIRPALYQRARTALLLMNCIAIIGYATFPLMPPRLLADCDTKYGGCDGNFRFVDTMDTMGGIWSWRGSALEKVSNHYAAMPSMHIGYALWVSTALAALISGGPFHPKSVTVQRILLGVISLYPLSVLFCIVVTANHYFMDAICGATVVGISYLLAGRAPQFGRGAARDWGPALLWVTGPNSSIVLVTERGERVTSDGEGLPLLAPTAPKNGSSAAAGSSGSGGSTFLVARDEAVVLDGDGSGWEFDGPSSVDRNGGSKLPGGGSGGNRPRSVQLVVQAYE